MELGPLISVIIVIAGAIIKSYEKRNKEAQRGLSQELPAQPVTDPARPMMQPIRPTVQLSRRTIQPSHSIPVQTSRPGQPAPTAQRQTVGNWPSSTNQPTQPSQTGAPRPASASQRRPSSTVGRSTPESFDIEEMFFDEEWLTQGAERSGERDIYPEVPKVAKPSPEKGRNERLNVETEDAEAYWRSGGKSHPIDEAQGSVQTTGKPSPLLERLTPQVLAQTIVLSEVLQPPRARRPYRPIYMDRDK